jgi:hypothetical protein
MNIPSTGYKPFRSISSLKENKMAFNMEALFRSDALASLGPERIQLFRQFARDIENKKGPEIAALYVRLNQSLSKIKPLTAAEKAAVIAAIRSGLDEADRAKFDGMVRFIRV